MPLSIKNPATEELAREVSALTGESLTTAITVALQERRDRLESTDMVERILAIGRAASSRMSPEMLAVDHGDLLYGPDGLP